MKKAKAGKRPKKKIVLFLVEGKSDREALMPVLSELYDRIDSNIQVYFPILRQDDEERGGDITSHFKSKPANIEKRIYEGFLEQFFDQEKIMPKDVHEVIQLVDTDGVYISDDAIVFEEDSQTDGQYYYDCNRILVPRACDVEYARDRNHRKRENLDYLVSLDTIKVKQKSVPYSIYYFSSNLDHFLHHNANMDPYDKRMAAGAFAGNYLNEDDGADQFVKLICGDPDVCTGQTYQESWAFIREEGFHSLERHSNLNILLERLMEEIQQEEI